MDNIMRLNLVFILLLTLITFNSEASNKRQLPVDESTTTNHSTKINGKTVKYSATVGTQPVWDQDGNPTASLFYTYYKRSDVKDVAPIVDLV